MCEVCEEGRKERMINQGVAFGWGQGMPVFLVGLVLVGLIFYAGKMRELWGKIGIGLMIIGGGGNLFERIIYGGVIDNWNFLGLFYNNVWDWLITVGFVIYFIGTHRARPRRSNT